MVKRSDSRTVDDHWLDEIPRAVTEEHLPAQVRERYRDTVPEAVETTVDVCPEPVVESTAAVIPEEDNVAGLERDARFLVGLVMGSFGIIGVVAAEHLLLGAVLAVIVLLVAGYLLATAKTAEDPVKPALRHATPA